MPHCYEFGGLLLDTLWQDIRYGARMLARQPGFTAVAVLTLALGIGANTAIFSVVHAVLLRPLPYPDADRLVKVWQHSPGTGFPLVYLSEGEWIEYRERQQSFEDIAVYVTTGANLMTRKPVWVQAGVVSANFFPVLGVPPLLGRTFTPEEDTPGHESVVVLEHGFWKRQFGGDPAILGQSVFLNGTGHTVVGVMPAGFSFPLGEIDLWAPLALDTAARNRSRGHYLDAVGRIKPTVTFAQATAEFDRLARQQQEENPDFIPRDQSWGGHLVNLRASMVGETRQALLLVLGAVALVLLVACANVAGLQLVRGMAREKEFAIRSALGASPRAILQQWVMEGLLLAFLAGAAGVLLAAWGLALITSFLPKHLLAAGTIQINLPVLSFTAGIALVTGLLFSAAPAWRSSRQELVPSLKEGGGRTHFSDRRRFRQVLVATEVAFSLVLLVGAGLMAKSVYRLLQVDPGFRTANLLTFRLSLPSNQFRESHQVTAFYRELVEKLNGLPGVSSVGATQHLPLSGSRGSWLVGVEGLAPQSGSSVPYASVEADFFSVTPGYFDTVGMQVVAGRGLEESDTAEATPVVVVDDWFARRFWPGGDSPLGKRVAILKTSEETPTWRTIVGVVRHSKQYGPAEDGREQMYFPDSQRPARSMFVTLRTPQEPTGLVPLVRQTVAGLDGSLSIYDVHTMEDRLLSATAQPRMSAWLLSLFASLALILAIVGLYGAVSYSVKQRTQEIGLRMALGAQPRDVLRLVVAQGMIPVLLGVAVGLGGALGVGWSLRSLLFGVGPQDPATLVGVSVLLLGVALGACWLPARRATRVDPMVALRYE